MTWMDIDDGILNHPKFIRAAKLGGSEAVHLWLGIRAYCAQQLTDGTIPRDMLDEVRGPAHGPKRSKALAALLQTGLLEIDGAEAYRLHDFLQWSKSRAAILAARARNAERQSRHRVTNAVSNAVTNAVSNPVSNPVSNDALSSPLLSTPKIPPLVSPPPGGVDLTPEDLAAFAPDPARLPKKQRETKPKPQQWRRFPPDFEPDETHKRLALQLNVNLGREMAAIRDHEFQKPKSDPAATLRTWLRNAPKFAPGPGGSPRARADPRAEMAELNADFDARGRLESSRRVSELLNFAEKMRVSNGR